jgi:predicted nuclease of predicted toxin-antitoxin system
VKLLLDEMFSRGLAERLRQRGHDVAAVLDAPATVRSQDASILAWARLDERAVVTRDLGDYRLLARRVLEDRASHAGLILVTARAFPEHDPRTAGRLFTALLALLEAAPDLRGREYWLR